MFLLKILILSSIIILYIMEENIFCRYCLQSFNIEEILKCHIKDCFKINGKQKIIMPKKGEYIKFKNYKRKVNSPYISYGDCESILVPEENEKQNPEASSTNKYEKHISCSYSYELVCADDKFSESFKIYLGKNTV